MKMDKKKGNDNDSESDCDGSKQHRNGKIKM